MVEFFTGWLPDVVIAPRSTILGAAMTRSSPERRNIWRSVGQILQPVSPVCADSGLRVDGMSNQPTNQPTYLPAEKIIEFSQ